MDTESQCRQCELSTRAANHKKNKRDNDAYFWRMKAKYANDARFRTLSSKAKWKRKYNLANWRICI